MVQQSGVLKTECTKSVSDCWKFKNGVYHYQGKTYEMELIYHMNGNRLEITWNIKNTGKEKMYISRKLRYLDSGQQRRRMHHMQPLNLGLEDAIKRILTEVWKKGNGDMR